MPKLILAYHGVGDYKKEDFRWIKYGQQRYNLKELSVSPDLFEKQLAYLCKYGYRPVSLKDYLAWQQKKIKLPIKSIVITFDDGFQNFFSFARPLLKKYGYTATVFLVTDKINSNDRNFLSWEEILRMKEEGFSFGAHTCSHAVLTSLPFEQAKQEIVESKKIIEEKLGGPIEFFSYPYGKFNPDISALVKETGFLGAVVTPSGSGLKEGPYSMKRTGINKNNSMLIFKFKINGGFNWLREQRLLWPIINKVKPS